MQHQWIRLLICRDIRGRQHPRIKAGDRNLPAGVTDRFEGRPRFREFQLCFGFRAGEFQQLRRRDSDRLLHESCSCRDFHVRGAAGGYLTSTLELQAANVLI